MKKNAKKINYPCQSPPPLHHMTSELIPKTGEFYYVTHNSVDFFPTVVKIQRFKIQPSQLF